MAGGKTCIRKKKKTEYAWGQFSVSISRSIYGEYRHSHTNIKIQVMCILYEQSHSAFINSIFVQQTALKGRDSSPQDREFRYFCCLLLFLFTVQYNKDKILLWDKDPVALLKVHQKVLDSLSLGFLSCAANPHGMQHPPELLASPSGLGWQEGLTDKECETCALICHK